MGRYVTGASPGTEYTLTGASPVRKLWLRQDPAPPRHGGRFPALRIEGSDFCA